MRISGKLVASLTAVAMAFASAVALAQPSASDATQQEEVARLIGLLDADSFDARERAARKLSEIGFPALEALRAAKEHPSLEVRWRARSLVENMTAGVRRREFSQFAALPDEKLDVEHGMWLIARILDPAVKKQDLTKQLDELAARVRERLGKEFDPAAANPQTVVAAVREVLFVECGFTGNASDYDNPDNSSLARVLETKKGLPILLSHVVVAVARRLRVPIVGIPAGGRYIVKYDGSKAPAGFPKADIYLCPFHGDKILTREDRLKDFPAHDPDVMVPPDTSRKTLTRMLTNLTSDLAGRGEMEKMQQAEELFELLEAHASDQSSER